MREDREDLPTELISSMGRQVLWKPLTVDRPLNESPRRFLLRTQYALDAYTYGSPTMVQLAWQLTYTTAFRAAHSGTSVEPALEAP